MKARGTPPTENNLISQFTFSFQLGEAPEKNLPSLANLSVTIPTSALFVVIQPKDNTS